MKILGLSGLYHDSAAALLIDGKLVAAAQEERFTRKKNEPAFPTRASLDCLARGGLRVQDLDSVVFYEKPFLKFDRLLIRHLLNWPRAYSGFSKMTEAWAGSKLRIPSIIRRELDYEGPIHFCRHHESHAAAAFFGSPFEEAAIVTVDGVGEWATAAIHRGSGHRIETLLEMHYPHSWGLFYSAFTDYLGFEINEGEYKVMGLAPYGKPVYEDVLKASFIRCPGEGLIELNLDLFSFERFDYSLDFARTRELLKLDRRLKSEPLRQEHFDLAASVQKILEDGLVELARFALKTVGSRRLCLGGGVALNCRANSMVRALPEVEDFYVFPAAGDAGGAVGAAAFAFHQWHQAPRVPGAFRSMALGPEFTDGEIKTFLARNRYPYRELAADELCCVVADLLCEQQIGGWFQGRMEFGPRALGHRSILGDPRRRENWDRINRKVKFREDFRPLAPAVPAERSSEFFIFEGESPYMLLTCQSRTDLIPAVTHVDGSCRLQTVAREDEPLFHRLLEVFGGKTGVPVLINTSFNTAGMPIVCTPQNAFQAFAESDLDFVVLGSFLLERKNFPYLMAASKARGS